MVMNVMMLIMMMMIVMMTMMVGYSDYLVLYSLFNGLR